MCGGTSLHECDTESLHQKFHDKRIFPLYCNSLKIQSIANLKESECRMNLQDLSKWRNVQVKPKIFTVQICP